MPASSTLFLSAALITWNPVDLQLPIRQDIPESYTMIPEKMQLGPLAIRRRAAIWIWILLQETPTESLGIWIDSKGRTWVFYNLKY